ncbi:MAG TPA: AmmeMemoRadiSam system protein A [Sandaracinaceae bacterium]
MTDVASSFAADGRVLLAAARDAIEAAVLGRKERRAPEESSPALARHRASFVTLRRADGALRGCIGELEARRPLIDSVRGCAVSAALRDPRFSPVTAGELDGIVIAVSVLTPAVPVRGVEHVIVGRHGVVIERGARRGVLLPEVAVEQGWDAATFVAHTCRKAGLPADAWLDPETRVSVFETVKLTER